MNIRVSLLLLFLGLIHTHLFAAKLETLVVQSQPNKTSIICIFSGSLLHKAFTLSQPDRVVLDLNNTSTAINVQHISLGQGIVAKIRSGHPNASLLRLVFDVKQPVSMSTLVTSLAANRHQLRIDLVQKGMTAMPRVNPLPVRVQHAPSRTLRDVVVVLDPGHGGKDPGARGPKHSYEKNIVLAIALKLKQMIDRQPGMRAVLTRKGDYYIGLRERLDIARRYNADIFVSIHADAFIHQHAHGASVFALSPMGATSEAARWLAEKENYSELGGVNLAGLDDRSGVIRTVLLDLSQTATVGSSLQMGNQVLGNLDKITNLHTGRVEQARFVVLKSPDIPSVLIETGFISNPREEMNLTSANYQIRLTQAIFAGIKGYFWDYPPHGTRVEAMSGANTRIVRAVSHNRLG